jgi:ATP adenylyltransferase
MTGGPLLAAGALAAAMSKRIDHASACGALQPVATESTTIKARAKGPTAEITLAVRVLTHFQRKQHARPATRSVVKNPFLPYDQDLFVGNLSDTHLYLLNKFPVLDNHLLMVTRAFVPQHRLLDHDDMAAVCHALREIDGLVFYNGGAAAGASQGHKHLQCVPLPLGRGLAPIPMAPLLKNLPFSHDIAFVDGVADPGELLAHYDRMIDGFGLRAGSDQAAPYNLLVTRNWMMMVPRREAGLPGIPVNGLGFAGALLVRDRDCLAQLQEIGPLNLLARVAGLPQSTKEAP